MKCNNYTRFRAFLLALVMISSAPRLFAVIGQESEHDNVGGVSWSRPVERDRALTFREGGRQLIEAIKQRNVFEASQLLRDGRVHPDSADDEGHSALMYAVQMGDIPIMQALLEAGVNVDAADRHGKTAIMYASERPDMGRPPAAACPLRKRITDKLLRRRRKEPVPVLVPTISGQPVQMSERFEDLQFSANAQHEKGIGQGMVGILYNAGARMPGQEQREGMTREAVGRLRGESVLRGMEHLGYI